MIGLVLKSKKNFPSWKFSRNSEPKVNLAISLLHAINSFKVIKVIMKILIKLKKKLIQGCFWDEIGRPKFEGGLMNY